MELSFGAASHVGMQRSHNEDNFLVDRELQLFIVADGMGGHAAGEVASSITVHQLREAVHENRDLLARFTAGDDDVQAVEVLQMLEHAVQAACSAVYDRAQAEQDKRGMGTTVSVLLLVDGPKSPRGFIAHVGDSRIYLVRQEQTHQLTEDHSLMNELVKRGKIKPGEIDNSPYKQFKNAVTRAVGVYPSVEVDTFDFDILPGDRFLMCTDGLYAYFDEEHLPGLLDDNEIRAVPKRLIGQANEGGGHDNITAVVLRVPDQAIEDADVRAADLSLKLEVLKGMPLFRYLSYKELVRVMNITETAAFAADDELIREGEPGETMFVVLEGRVRLHKGDNTITQLGRGQHFGEMALVDRSPRSLSASAVTASRLLAIRRKDFYEIIKKEPGLSVKLLWSFVQVLAERLRKTTVDLDTARKPSYPPFATDDTLAIPVGLAMPDDAGDDEPEISVERGRMKPTEQAAGGGAAPRRSARATRRDTGPRGPERHDRGATATGTAAIAPEAPHDNAVETSATEAPIAAPNARGKRPTGRARGKRAAAKGRAGATANNAATDDELDPDREMGVADTVPRIEAVADTGGNEPPARARDDGPPAKRPSPTDTLDD